MADLSMMESNIDYANSVISGFRSPQSSESCTVMTDRPRTPTNEFTEHADGHENKTVEPPIENANRVDDDPSSKFVAVLSPVSPPSSESRANLRTEFLNGSLPERPGFNKPPLSFGSVVANAPVPVFTAPPSRSHRQLGLREQPPLMHIPNLNGSVNYDNSSRTEDSNSVSNSRRATPPTTIVNSRSTSLEQHGRSNTEQIFPFQTMDAIMGVNPYMRRADDIGFCHQVPGVGHLGSYLVPHGWKEGDPPITPAEAKKLFDIDHQEAVRVFDTSLANQEHLNDKEKKSFSALIHDQWKAQLLLDHLVLAERVSIYEQHLERQQRKLEHLRENEQPLSQNFLSGVLQPIQPRAMTSYLQGPPLEPPCWQRLPNYPNQMNDPFGYPRTEQNFGPCQSHMGPEKSPIALDYRQMSTRKESAYTPCQPNTVEIAQQALDNQQYFNAHGSVYKPHGAEEQRSQIAYSSSNNARATVYFEGNNAWTSSHGCPPEQGPIPQFGYDPLTYNSYPHVESFGLEYPPVKSAGFEENFLSRSVQYQPVQNGYGGPANTNIHHGGYNLPLNGRQYEQNPQYMTPQIELSPIRDWSMHGEDFLENSRNDINNTGDPTISKSNVPQIGGQSRQEPSNRTQPRQKEDSTASGREMHLAQQSDHEANGIKTTVELPTTPEEPTELNERVAETNSDKTRQWYEDKAELTNLPAMIPDFNFVQKALEVAGSEGAKGTPRKRRPKPEVNATTGFSISDAAAKVLAFQGIPDHRRNSWVASSGAIPGGNATSPDVAPAPGGLSSTYIPSPPQKANYLYSLNREEQATPESENGSDHVEDPNDGDYGKRTTRRKNTTPRKCPTSRSNTGLKKKRKAAVSVTPVKRTRLSMNGLVNHAEDDVEGSDEPAM